MTPWIGVTFAVALGMSALAAWNTELSNQRMTANALKTELEETTEAVVRRIQLYQFGLRGLRGAVHAAENHELSLAAFERYSQTRDVAHEFPGARGFGFISRVAEGQEQAFVARERRDGRPDFTLHQFRPHAGERFVVRYISPLLLNPSGVGLDIASEQTRKKAAIDAMLSGQVQLTRPIIFFESPATEDKAFLMLLPVYASPTTPANDAERQASAIGWTYAALQIDEVLENLGVYHTGLGLQLSDISASEKPELFYSSPDVSSDAPVLMKLELDQEIFGRQWRLQMFAYPAFVDSLHQTSPRLVMVVGVLISSLLAAVLGTLENLRRRRIEIFTDQARLAAIVESSSDGIIGKDLTGVITSWNKGAEHIFGYTSDQAVGKRLADLVVPVELQAEEKEILARINRGERVEHFETERLHRDGRRVDVSVAVAPIRDGTGLIIGASKTVRDISAQKAAEATLQALYTNLEHQVAERTAQLQQAKLQADSANAAKSSFLANMSHEIRTPLNAVLGMLQLLAHTPLAARQSDYVGKARLAAKSLLDLLNDILDFSKIEAGKLQLDVHRFELETLMRALAVVLAGNQGDKEVEVVFDLSPSLPSVLIGDSLRLQQILINLAGNALKFTNKGYVIVSVSELNKSADEVTLRIAVTDTGIGIAQEQQAHIFEGFAQAEASTSRRFGGSGLGLVICRRLVELMGGQLQVVSEQGKGSRFWFDLRFVVESDKTLGADCPTTERPLHILIAEDNQIVAELMRSTVMALGWHAELVSNGRQAVEHVRAAQQKAHPYDVVLMDWRMPELDGLRAAQMIHDDRDSVQQPMVVMITAYGREALAELETLARSPFIDFLTKPVTPQQLAFTVTQALGGNCAVTSELSVPVPGSTRLQGLRILVVEDNALNRIVAGELLSHEGAQVELAEDGLQGVTLALDTSRAFDVVIMDIQMPDIDGFEATRRIRAEPGAARLPILAMTANASEADRRLCLDAGMDDHVGKPIDIDQVVSAVLRLVGHPTPERLAREPIALRPDAADLIEDGASILSRFGMNLDLLQRLYQDFQQDSLILLDDLQRHIEQRDSAAQSLLLHSLKGSAGSLGAKALQRRAGELEQLFRVQPQQAQALLADPQTLDDLHALLAASTAQLGQWLARASRASSTPQSTAPLSAEQWREQCEELAGLLADGNLRALELGEALARSNHAPWFAEVAAHISALRFDQAQQCLHQAIG